jgi:Domain of unknown function (DUF4249)
MINSFKYTFFTISVLGICMNWGCSKNFNNYDPNYEGNKLVANGLLTETGLLVSLTQSLNPLSLNKPEDNLIKKGRVWLYRNDSLTLELSFQGKDKFISKNFTPKVGLSYKIKAIAEGFDTLISENIIFPPPPNIKTYKLIKNDSLAVNSTYRGAAFFSAQLKDSSLLRNRYMLDSYTQIRTDSIYPYELKGTVDDGNSTEACEFDSYANIVFFTDKCFDGNEYTINYFTEHQRKGILVIELSSIDDAFLRYLRTLEQPTGLALGFAEPKIQYSNIKNGYGVFIAKNTKSFSLKL